jgi:NAD(P)-dependent dehydrogenase (short-subunit alcohol dehydrogenase family)
MKLKSHGVVAFAHKVDVSREHDVQAMFAAAIAKFGTIDIPGS